jgi:ferritin-like metal-binding protein YciE
MASQAIETARDLYVTGLKNAHALEHQALALMDRQIEHLMNYADVEQALRAHRGETERQIERLERLLEAQDASPSTVKDMALSLSGNLAALGHSFAPDEIIKNSLANYAFESFEVATYMSLITLAEEAGVPDAIPILEETLREEQQMQALVAKVLPTIVRKFVSLRAAGETASH